MFFIQFYVAESLKLKLQPLGIWMLKISCQFVVNWYKIMHLNIIFNIIPKKNYFKYFINYNLQF